jgi:hypothetical protein
MCLRRDYICMQCYLNFVFAIMCCIQRRWTEMEINQPIHQAANPLPGFDGSDEESLLEMLGLNRPSQCRRMNRSPSFESDLSSDTSTARANNGISQGSAAASNTAETSQISSTRPANNAT